MRVKSAMVLITSLVVLAGCRKTKPDCFECGLSQEWAEAERREAEARGETWTSPGLVPTAEEEPKSAEEPSEKGGDGGGLVTDEPPSIPAPPDQQCEKHTEAISACATRGPNFVYQLRIPHWRKGTRPPDGWEEEARKSAQCQCFDKTREAKARDASKRLKSKPSISDDPQDLVLPE